MKKTMILMLLPVVICTWAIAQPGMNGGHNVLTAEEEAAEELEEEGTEPPDLVA